MPVRPSPSSPSETSMSTALSRVFLPLAAAVLFACGSAPGQLDGTAPRDLGLDLGVGPGPICVGPACVGQHLESLTLGPVEPPVIESNPLGPSLPPPIPLPAPAVCLSTTVAMQLLGISADGAEPTLPAIQEALGFHTVPFTP